MSEDLRVSLSGGVLEVVFDRPQARNAMTFAMYEGLHEACVRADEDEQVRVLVLRGAGGAFVAGTDTAVESTADAVQAMFKVFNDMRREEVTPVELVESKTRVAGGFVMDLQTIQQQASYRVSGILNGFPIDYYDRYPERVGQVSAKQIRDVLAKYVKDGEVVVVVVAPAEAVKEQLQRLGEVEVLPMPAKREGAKDLGKNELLKKAA